MLRWADVDAEAGLVTVRHGKGGKERVAAILDSTEGTELALGLLRESQPENTSSYSLQPHQGAGPSGWLIRRLVTKWLPWL